MIKIAETNDIKSVIKTVKNFGGETLGLEKALKMWFALKGKIIVGTVGVIKLDKNNWVLEPLAIKMSYRNKGIEERLIKTAMKYLKDAKAKHVFCMTKYIKYYQKFGFKKISLEDVSRTLQKPLRTTSCEACFTCKKWNKKCFPALMTKKLGE
jgi:N-acetylglutamate synthase-like GNAT family acetyltransferase